MTMILPAALVLIIVVAVASLGPEGMWSNAIVLFNVVTSALVATSYWEPATAWMRVKMPGGVYVFDYLMLWGIFALTYTILRTVTDSVSRTRVRFPKMVDQIGSYFFAVWVGWVLVCFTTMTFHTAPLSRDFLFGAFKAEDRMLFGLAPDRQWLGFMQKVSGGAFSRTAPADKPEQYLFDPRAEYIPKYATRRSVMQKGLEVWVSDKRR